ncbi:MAG: hypothetical protein ACXAEF_10520 [Candidatus Thorarchaeota archaeon]|jgi:hypothetical protein
MKSIGKSQKAQSSLELVTIAAVALTVLTLFIFLSQGQVVDINKAKVDSEAKNALSDISAAAKEVYSQGIGAKKRVYVTLPSDVDPLYTEVANTSIRMRVAGHDYLEAQAFDVHGNLPTTEGGHFVWVESEGNKVRIGNAMVELSRQVLLISLLPNETETKSLDITNIWSSNINVSLTDNWNKTDASFSLNKDSASLSTNETTTVIATVVTSNDAVGIYIYELTIIADDGLNNTESVNLPIIVQVLADPNARPPLLAIPPVFNASLNRSENATRLFQICTNARTAVSYVNFSPSAGEPGDWMSGLSQSGAIGKDSCIEKYLTLTVPNDSALDNHTGFISLTSDVAAATDSLGLAIEVGGGGDIEGPIARNITTSVPRVHVWEPTTILAYADDNSTGGSRIKSCAISADNGPWEYMFPVDGLFNESIEQVSYTYFSGFDFGDHNVSINCTDWPGNIGPTANYSFVIGKYILFVIASGNQSDWSDWITVHYSGEGLSWEFDIVDFNEVISGSTNMSYYDIVIFLDWSTNDDFVDLVNKYHDNGGYLGLFGDSAHQAVRDLNLTWHPDNPHPETQVNILNNSHYVTNPFSTGLLTISDTNTKIYSVWGDPVNTTELGASGWFYPATSRILLAEVDRIIFWGPEDPWSLNEDGSTIAIRVIDYMINSSEIN